MKGLLSELSGYSPSHTWCRSGNRSNVLHPQTGTWRGVALAKLPGARGFLSRINFAVDAAENVLLWTSVKRPAYASHGWAASLLEILRAAGVEYIIGNPGTTELPLMDVLPDHPEFKYILTLQEGVAMAMADGYALAQGNWAC